MKEKQTKSLSARAFIRRHFSVCYGADELSYVLTVIALLLLLVNQFFSYAILPSLAVALLCVVLFRISSHNIESREKELRWYRTTLASLKRHFGQSSASVTGDVIIKTCPRCNRKLRLKNASGSIKVTCPRCNHSFKTSV